ncbi:hypothetical protein NL676_012917 [Syzygium grande]|nr:hypothetical protein NL676_012917 [Syzygium grande]
MAGVSLKCSALLKSVEEAQGHAELTSHSNFSESTEAVLNLVCSFCKKPYRSKIVGPASNDSILKTLARIFLGPEHLGVGLLGPEQNRSEPGLVTSHDKEGVDSPIVSNYARMDRRRGKGSGGGGQN